MKLHDIDDTRALASERSEKPFYASAWSVLPIKHGEITVKKTTG